MNKNWIISGLCLIGILATGAPVETNTPYGKFKNEAEMRDALGIVAKLNRQERAFHKVIFEYLLTEANNASTKLNLATAHPLSVDAIKDQSIPSPFYSLVKNTNYLTELLQIRHGTFNAQGWIETTNYNFILQEGRLIDIHSVKDGFISDEFAHEARFIDPAVPPLLMSTNEAYQIATQCLAAIEINVVALEKKYGSRLKIEQGFYLAYSDAMKAQILADNGWGHDYSAAMTNQVKLPIWKVVWQGGAEVKILGTTKQLVGLRLADYTLSQRPPLILPGVEAMEKYARQPTNLPLLHLQRPPQASPTNNPRFDSGNPPLR